MARVCYEIAGIIVSLYIVNEKVHEVLDVGKTIP